MIRRSPAAAPNAAETRRGFTLVELLIVVAVTTFGFVALFHFQAAGLRGLTSARRMLEATTLAENFVEQLRIELMSWTESQDLSDPNLFPRLGDLPTGAAAHAGGRGNGDGGVGGDMAAGWMIGDEDGGDDRRVSVVGDLYEINNIALNSGIRDAITDPNIDGLDDRFCLLYRLTWLVPDRAIRAEVEVSWPLDSADMDRFVQCNFNASSRLSEVRSVHVTTTIARNFFAR